MSRRPPLPTAELLLENISTLYTMDYNLAENALGSITGGVVAIAEGKILWAGHASSLSEHVKIGKNTERIDAARRIVTPGLIDCHTHLVFAGSREGEFERKIRGATYQEIAASGGGIVSTMKATREADFDTLLDLGLSRLKFMLEHGVTTCEIKSGYGLSVQDELKQLEVIETLNQSQPVSLVPTCLGAHVVPPEFKQDRAGYVRLLVEELLPTVAQRGLAECVDVFCDTGAFTLEETREILTAAKGLGFKLKVHAEQLTHTGAAALGAELGALSVEHLEHIRDDELEALRRAGTVAVLLPGAAMFLGLEFPDARRFIQAQVKVAVATDFNPGSSPSPNLPLMGTLAATRMRLPLPEVLRGMTINASAAVGRSDRIGRLTPGLDADLAVFDALDYRTLFYHFGMNHCMMVIKQGEVVYP